MSWNEGTITRFRAQGGKGIAPWGDNLLILHTKGAKSGNASVQPLVYHLDAGRYVIAASKGGAPTNPGWYHNLVSAREAEIEVATDRGVERFRVRATPIAKGPERDRLYEDHAKVFRGFADYPAKTTRIIPVVVLERIEEARKTA
jgi:deazaflavin-dependent oxidoreductase (nitroreductase family)